MAASNSFDRLAFRRALGNFATGITVVTATSSQGEKVGMTANSFNSVSLDPPLILWSIDKKSHSFTAFKNASHFAVNILAADQLDLSNHFAKPAKDKFAGIEIETGLGNAPRLPNCSAIFECKLDQCIEAGDHWILIGKVENFHDTGRAPLLYHQGSYSWVMPIGRKKDSNTPENIPSDENNRLDNYLYFLMLQAVRSYQSDYQPKQLTTGLRTAEARILLSLQSGRKLNQESLSLEVSMPQKDIQNAFEVLKEKEFIEVDNGLFSLKPLGADMAALLWQLAMDEQQEKFKEFTEQELSTFRKILFSLINH